MLEILSRRAVKPQHRERRQLCTTRHQIDAAPGMPSDCSKERAHHRRLQLQSDLARDMYRAGNSFRDHILAFDSVKLTPVALTRLNTHG